MKNFDTRVYSVADFLEWRNGNLLDLSPDFQRRAVWTEKAKSFLVDTLIREKPIPKLILSQELRSGRNVRVVVDGQQRLRAIFEFIDGAFTVSRAHNPEIAGIEFDSLPDEVQRAFLKYELGVDLLFDPEYEDLLDIFARINTYTVRLNRQERFNARYLGFFKQSVYEYGRRYVQYFLRGGVLTKNQVSRMGEAELAADLMISLLGGVQTNKAAESFYKSFEDTPGELDHAKARFDEAMSFLGALYPPEELANTNWSRIHLFYTLFTSIAHLLFGINGLKSVKPLRAPRDSVARLRVRLDDVSSEFDSFTGASKQSNIPEEYRQFIEWSRRGTTDTQARVGRANFVVKKLCDALGSQ